MFSQRYIIKLTSCCLLFPTTSSIPLDDIRYLIWLHSIGIVPLGQETRGSCACDTWCRDVDFTSIPIGKELGSICLQAELNHWIMDMYSRMCNLSHYKQSIFINSCLINLHISKIYLFDASNFIIYRMETKRDSWNKKEVAQAKLQNTIAWKRAMQKKKSWYNLVSFYTNLHL
jgi:hypothetical protein